MRTRTDIQLYFLLCFLYTDRGSHYWTTTEAGGKVDKHHLMQFGRGIKAVFSIAVYSPQVHG